MELYFGINDSRGSKQRIPRKSARSKMDDSVVCKPPRPTIPIVQWLRGPSQSLMAETKRLVSQASQIAHIEEELGLNKRQRVMTKVFWDQSQDELVVKIASNIMAKLLPDQCEGISVDRFDENCPGFSSCLRALHSSMWSSIGKFSHP